MKRRRRHGFLKFFLFFALAALLSVVASFFVFSYISKTLPPPQLIQNRLVAESTKIYDRTGSILLYEIYGEERRTIIPFKDIPDSIKKATITAEDVHFYDHSAFDWKSVVRAFIANLLEGRVVQGGSTITQQLAKKAFLSDERTLTRKLRELVLALELEKRFTKDQILESYLNQIPYGSNAYGIEAASQLFFGKSARNLNLSEAALLAGLSKAPSYYSPWGTNTKAMLARHQYVLSKMLEAGLINEKEEKEALAYKLTFAKPLQAIKAPHFVLMVQDYLNKQYGEDFVRNNGLKVITTLDWDMQQSAENTVSEHAKTNAELYKGTNAALVAEDPKTGQVLALVGSKDYFDTGSDGNFNVAAQGLRQPGSALKPFVYAAAFKKGYTPETVVFDLETEFDTTGIPENSYKPGNYDGGFRGPITLRRALAQSINVPAVKVLYLVGLKNALGFFKDFGINTLTEKGRYGLSLVLGGGEVKLVDLVNAYSVFANDGVGNAQSLILSVSAKNKILEEYRTLSKRVIDSRYARLIDDILSDAEARAPIFGSSLNLQQNISHQVAVKTGTSNDYRDAWTVGYTPSLVVGIWAGNNNNEPMSKEGASIRAAVPIWRDFMNNALKALPEESFLKPDPIFVEKPMLRGEYLVQYKSGDQVYPQIHELLFYVDKNDPLGQEPKNPENDPQFTNWENPVLAWARSNIQNFSAFNQPPPFNSLIVNNEQNKKNSAEPQPTNKLVLVVKKPANGEFIAGIVSLEAQISSGSSINKVDVYFNNVLIDTRKANLGNNYVYQYSFNAFKAELQNLLKIDAFDDGNNKTSKEIILFKQT